MKNHMHLIVFLMMTALIRLGSSSANAEESGKGNIGQKLYEVLMAKNEFIAIADTNDTPQSLKDARKKRSVDLDAAFKIKYTPQQIEDAVNDILDELEKNKQYSMLGMALSYNSGISVDRRKNIEWAKELFLNGNYSTFFANYITNYGVEEDLDVLRTVIARLPDKDVDPPQKPEDLKSNELVSLRRQIKSQLHSAEYEYKQKREAAKNSSPDISETVDELPNTQLHKKVKVADKLISTKSDSESSGNSILLWMLLLAACGSLSWLAFRRASK